MTQTYPEHEKLHAVRDESQAQRAFVEWLSTQGVQLMRWEESGWVPDGRSIEALLDEYHGIDRDELAREAALMDAEA